MATLPHVTNTDVLPIPGLLYFPNFLTKEEERELCSLVDSLPFSEVIHRRQQFHGEWYYHTTHDVAALQPAHQRHQAAVDALPWRRLVHRLMHSEPYNRSKIFEKQAPNQCLVNEYVVNQGISSHFEDFDSFGDTIVTVSLLSPIYMTLKKPAEVSNQCQNILAETRVLLEPRSCLVMRRECRYEWRHGISKTKLLRMPDGHVVHRGPDYRRLSLTIRRVLEGRRRTVASADSRSFKARSSHGDVYSAL